MRDVGETGQRATTDGKGTFTLSGLTAGNVNLSIAKVDYAPGFASASTQVPFSL